MGVRVFLNAPDAHRETSINSPHYVGSLSSFPGPGEAGRQPTDFYLDLGPTLRHLKQARVLRPDLPLTVTLMAVPLDPQRRVDDQAIPCKKVIVSVNRE